MGRAHRVGHNLLEYIPWWVRICYIGTLIMFPLIMCMGLDQ